jgi:hypothetical protein
MLQHQTSAFAQHQPRLRRAARIRSSSIRETIRLAAPRPQHDSLALLFSEHPTLHTALYADQCIPSPLHPRFLPSAPASGESALPVENRIVPRCFSFARGRRLSPRSPRAATWFRRHDPRAYVVASRVLLPGNLHHDDPRGDCFVAVLLAFKITGSSTTARGRQSSLHSQRHNPTARPVTHHAKEACSAPSSG